mmetsp:Transcript_12660/g.30691  ORF Transcript_12660/g.30691 Transcript_12660/m.30691 type:complete len:137 (+) Transcript_12660:1334-1744(+)
MSCIIHGWCAVHTTVIQLLISGYKFFLSSYLFKKIDKYIVQPKKIKLSNPTRNDGATNAILTKVAGSQSVQLCNNADRYWSSMSLVIPSQPFPSMKASPITINASMTGACTNWSMTTFVNVVHVQGVGVGGNQLSR